MGDGFKVEEEHAIVGNTTEVRHEDGRVCRYSEGHWWVRFMETIHDWRQEQPGLVECVRPHVGDQERGDLGMPTIGGAISDLSNAAGITTEEAGEVAREAISRFRLSMPEFNMEVRQDCIKVDFGEVGFHEMAFTEEARVILSKVLPYLLQKFLQKNAKYARAQSGHDLGVKGIIPDINRKTAALITRLWDGAEAGSEEGTFELAEDLVGHLLLMLAKMRMSDDGVA